MPRISSLLVPSAGYARNGEQRGAPVATKDATCSHGTNRRSSIYSVTHKGGRTSTTVVQLSDRSVLHRKRKTLEIHFKYMNLEPVLRRGVVDGR